MSLKAGAEGCVAATSAAGLVKAHQNLENAVYIFRSQESDKAYLQLAISEHRSCLNVSRFSATSYSKDLFSADLVEVMLSLDEPTQARALIEKMESPVFKLRGTIALGVYEQKPFDRQYYSRLEQYIRERVPSQDQAAARWELSTAAVNHAAFAIQSADILSLSKGALAGITCDLGGRRDTLQSAFAMQRSLVTLPAGRRGYSKGDVPSLLTHIAGVASSCSGTLLTLQIHGQLVLLSLEVAAEFAAAVTMSNFNDSEQVTYLVGVLSEYEDLFKAELGLGSHSASGLVDFEPFLRRRDAQFPVFKAVVDFGEVCEATSRLFNNIKGTEYYDDAVAYMVRSPAVDIDQKHSCGDSDLELLLN